MKRFGYYLAFICMSIGLILAISLFSYNQEDISFIYQTSNVTKTQNLLGSFGANIAGLAIYFLGFTAWGLIFLLLAFGLVFLNILPRKNFLDRIAFGSLLLLVFSALSNLFNLEYYKSIYPDIYSGGLIGGSINSLLFSILDKDLVYIFLFTLAFSCSVIILRFKSIIFLAKFIDKIILNPAISVLLKLNYIFVKFFNFIKKHAISLFKEENYQEENIQNIEAVLEDIFWQDYLDINNNNINHESKLISESIIKEKSQYREIDYCLPCKSLNLSNTSISKANNIKKEENIRIKILEEKLSKFGINGIVTKVVKGPVVSLFEYKPTIDTKISNILSRQDDLALALQAHSLRIIAPIPGKDVVGFEISHQDRQVVNFNEICSFIDIKKFKLPLVLGKNVIGEDIVIDLAMQPHLLVAGSTGSGKSVGLNCMINTLLFYTSPEKVKFILIDPKRLEFIAYQDIAHLLFPIITDANKAIVALKWAVNTMEKRYELLSQSGAKNIEEYNNLNKNNLDYIVIVIDELADLIMVAGKEIEYLLTRLAQMARAAGIHMIVATQRPSVDIITGTIKVNFPSRVAFKVTSKVDSRTILDFTGAERLLGKGDMLFLNSSGNLERIHGAYISNKDIEKITKFIKQQKTAQYIDLNAKILAPVDQEVDVIYNNIITFIQDKEEISISQIQRVFKVGYNRSARIVDQLEADGYILPPGNGKMRRVVKQN